MASPIWQASTQYPAGSIVQRASSPAPVLVPIVNDGFEAGAVSWNFGGDIVLDSAFRYQGANSLRVNGTGTLYPQINTAIAVTAGTSVTASCMYHQGGASSGDNKGRVCLIWYTAGLVEISKSFASSYITSSNGGWKKSTVTATAPATAAFVKIAGESVKTDGGNKHNFDNFVWDLTAPVATSGLEFKAVQSGTGTSAGTEPTWPSVLGNTVVDGSVTWQAVTLSSVTWTADPDLVSGATEPTWATGVGNYTLDGIRLQWEAISRTIDDPKCPQKTVVSIGASKVFVGDDDIMRFSATVNPLDWTSERDAGYLPTGLQQAGANNITVSGLYRNNLVVFNANCFQMWQIDPDPESMALLDQMQGIGSVYQQAAQEVADELFFLSAQGVRTIGLSASSESLQSGDVGSPVDSLVVPSVANAVSAGLVPRATYYTGAGQYWLATDFAVENADFNYSLLNFDGDSLTPSEWEAIGNPVVALNFSTVLDGGSNRGVQTLSGGYVKTTIDSDPFANPMGNKVYVEMDICKVSSSVTPSPVIIFKTEEAEAPSSLTITFSYDVFATISVETATDVKPITLAWLAGERKKLRVEIDYALMKMSIYVDGVAYFPLTSITDTSQHWGIHYVGYTGSDALDMNFDNVRVGRWFIPNNSNGVIYQNVFVYTQNQVGKIGSWSRYTFPYTIDGFATLGNNLYIRGNNGTDDCVYMVDENYTHDDGFPFEGLVQYPWLDFGTAGVTKMMETVDIVGDGTPPTISIGYDQTNPYAVTTPYQLQADSMTGFPVPIPVSAPTFSIKLVYPEGSWELQQFNVEIRQNWKIR